MSASLALALVAALETGDVPRTLDECEARVRRRPALEAYRCFWIVARQNRADEAEARLRARIVREPADHWARLALARIGVDRGRDWAEPLSREAIAGFAAAGDAEGEVLARLGLSLLFRRRLRLPEVEAEVKAAARVAEAHPEANLMPWVRNESAWLSFAKGDYGRAWQGFKKMEDEVVPDGPLDLQASCLAGLAGAAQETGRIDESVVYVRRVADLNHRMGDYYTEAQARGNLVLSAFRLGMQGQMDPPEIVALAREALAAAVGGGNRGTEARAHLYLGDLLAGTEAREHYRQGLEISRETKETAGLVLGLRGLALSLVEHEPRDPERALRLAEEAIGRARGSGFYTAIARLARARVRWITGPREKAVADSLAALDAVEAIRELQQDALVRARVFSLWAFAYYRLAGRLLDAPEPSPEDLELAFSVAERMRARVLLDELDAAQATAVLLPKSPAQERRTALLKDIVQAQRRLMDPALGADERRAALAELDRLENEDAALRAEMARDDPAYAALRHPRLPTLAELRAALAGDEALLAFQVAPRRNLDNRTTENGSWLWVHTREATQVYRLPDQDDLRGPIALFLGLVERRDGADAEGAAPLFQALLERPLAELPPRVTRLVIVPDGVLHRLPFDALRASPHDEPLGAGYEISLAPSATVWLRLRQQELSRAPVPALVLADPEPPGAAEKTSAERAWALNVGSRLGRLPHARQEARFVTRRLGGGSQMLLGPLATERFLKQADLERFAVLHLAAHAVLDDEKPERSAILLSPGAADEDGLLQIREIVGLDLGGRLVVLSACRSAAGPLLQGEGVLGLARAFFQAGARTVIGSLWPLRDDDAGALVRAFYARLAEGRSVAAAMSAARRERIRSGVPAAAWSGLVVLGDGSAVPVRAAATSSASRLLLAGAATLLLALAALLARRLLASVPPPRG